MGNFIQSYHTDAKGADFGWHATITHPAHFKDKDALILDASTAWNVKVSSVKTLKDAQKQALKLAMVKFTSDGLHDSQKNFFQRIWKTTIDFHSSHYDNQIGM